MKKLALALVASTVAVSAASANIGTGFYLGAALGYASTNAKVTGGNGGTRPGSNDAGASAANIGIHGGYGWVTGCLYFGGEVGYTFENSKVSQSLDPSSSGGQAQLKRSGYFNAALRGGYLFTPNTMMYVRLGANWSRWKVTDSGFMNGNTNATGSNSRLAFAPGVGLETAVHKNVYLRLEYNYEFGPSVTANNGSNTANNFTRFSTIRNQSGKIGLSYKF